MENFGYIYCSHLKPQVTYATVNLSDLFYTRKNCFNKANVCIGWRSGLLLVRLNPSLKFRPLCAEVQT